VGEKPTGLLFTRKVGYKRDLFKIENRGSSWQQRTVFGAGTQQKTKPKKGEHSRQVTPSNDHRQKIEK